MGREVLWAFERYTGLLNDIHIAPTVREAELRLRQRFGDQNPLEAFGPGQKPASEELVLLLRQNELPYGKESQWRQEWRRSLEREPSDYWRFNVTVDRALAPERISQAALSVDSTIKHRIINRDRSPVETWTEYCQRIFEQDWIRFVVRSIFANKEGPGLPQTGWDLKLLQTFLRNIIVILSKQGYYMKVPAENRLNALILRVSRGDTVREEDW
jgi:hypothetical protein